MPPAARITDMHTCPMVNPGPVPHVGGPISTGDPSVLIGMMPAARVGDVAVCTGPPDSIAKGSMSVLVGCKPTARVGDNTVHGGVIVAGCPSVLIGDLGGGPGAGGGGGAGGGPRVTPAGANAQVQTLIDAKRAGVPFCEVCAGVAPAAIAGGQSAAPAERKPPPPDPKKVSVCSLQSLQVQCQHLGERVPITVGQTDRMGRPITAIEVVADNHGDVISLLATLDKPYCPEHLKKPLSVTPGELTSLVASPMSAQGTVRARAPLDLLRRLRSEPFSLLWPRSIKPWVYQVRSPTCSQCKTLELRAYPDLRWKIQVQAELGASAGSSIGSSRRLDGYRDRRVKKKVDVSSESEFRAGPTTCIEVSYGREKIDLADQLEAYIKTVLTFARVASNMVGTTSRMLGDYAGTKFELKLPSVFLAFEWGWVELPDWRVDYELKGSVGFDPFIGVGVDVDIIAALLGATGSPALARLKNLLDGNIAEVGVYLKAEGSIGGSLSVSRTLGNPRYEVSGDVNGKVEVSLEGRAKLEKKWLVFNVSANLTLGGRTSLEATARPLADDTGFGAVFDIGWDPLILYLEFGVSAGFELDKKEAHTPYGWQRYEEESGLERSRQGSFEHRLWDTVDIVKNSRFYFVRNATGGAGP